MQVIRTSNSQYIGECDAEGKTFTVAPQRVSSISDILIHVPLIRAMALFKEINLSGLFAAFQGLSLQAAAQSAFVNRCALGNRIINFFQKDNSFIRKFCPPSSKMHFLNYIIIYFT